MRRYPKTILCHTCKPPYIGEAMADQLMTGVKYFSENLIDKKDKPAEYQAMPTRCRCRLRISLPDSEQLVELGLASYVYFLRSRKLRSRSKIEVDEKQVIILPSRTQTPRVDMITAADIERAFIDGNKKCIRLIEDVHTMIIMARLEMFRSFTPDPQEGRVLFPFGKDQRTNAR